jgi:hypothetical protein
MRIWFVIILGVGACKSKSTDASETSQGSAAPSEAAKPAPVPSSPPKITCDKAIPKSVQDKFLAKAATEHGEPFEVPGGGMLTSCRFQETEPDRRTIVAYRCGEPFADLPGYLKSIESQVAVKYERFPSPGRGAYKSSRTFGVLHRSMPCIIEVEGMRGDPMIDLQAFATDLEAALAP